VNRRTVGLLAGVLALGLAVAGCSSSSSKNSKAASAKSAADLGGMDQLAAAAKKEGTLNVITLPRTWANYGAIMDDFTAKYGIKITDANPDGTSADEITAIKSLKGQSRAPDVVDIGPAFTTVNKNLFAPYKVATWNDIPDSQKDADGAFYQDYGGYVSIGYDANRIKTPPTSFADLKNPEYKGLIGLQGDPTQAGAGFAAVYAASLANGGSLDDIKPGIDYFGALKQSGNYITVAATKASVESGQVGVTIDWDYNQVAFASALKGSKVDWKVVVPKDGLYASYYNQAISATAPHPAAARLWEEYLYSAEGQNLYLKGAARPVTLKAMQTGGTVDQAALSALPAVSGTAQLASETQIDKAKAALVADWTKAVS